MHELREPLETDRWRDTLRARGRYRVSAAEFNRKKFEELIIYIARRLPPQAALGRVKLAKLLMLADYTAYVRRGRSITGATYEKWEHGHLPREFIRSEKDLAVKDVRIEPVDYYGKELKHITAQRDPDMRDFDEDELAIIEGVLKFYGHESASYLSQLSHEELGWRLADQREVIPYQTIFLSKTGPADSDIRRGEELASLHGWD
jgi:hypothetical protein